MTGTTHAVVGAATALATACLVSGSLSVEAGTGIAVAGMAGGVLADIDVKQSKAATWTRYGIAICVIGLVVTIVTGSKVRFNAATLGGLALFVALAIWGMQSPHREKTHSLVFAIGFSVAIYLAGGYAWAFGLGYLSHLAIDFPNKKGECLLWPLPKRFCLGLCGANGIVSKCLCALGCVVCAACLIV